MKTIIRKFARSILKIFYPRLYLIEKHAANVTELYQSINDCHINTNAKICNDVHMSYSTVDAYTYISSNCKLSYTKIGKFCSIGPNLLCGFGIHPTNGLSTSPAFYSTRNQVGITFSNDNKIKERLPIEIGNDVFIGMNVTILDGVTIGDGAVIGAGAVVSKDIPPYAIAVGSPIKVIKYRFDESTIKELLKIKWWDFDKADMRDVERYFFDPTEFINKYKNHERI